jgi:hypothetical protein
VNAPRLAFHNDYPRFALKYGVLEGQVRRALDNRPLVYHVAPELAAQGAAQFSFHWDRTVLDPGRDSYSVLVFTVRLGDARVVRYAWRLYDSDVHTEPAQSARDALLALVNRYGLPLLVNGELVPILEMRRIPGPLTPSLIRVGHREGLGYLLVAELEPESGGTVFSYITFALNEAEMLHDLRGHGYRGVTRVTNNPPSPLPICVECGLPCDKPTAYRARSTEYR